MRIKKEWRMTSRENYVLFCEEYPEISLSFVEWQNIIYHFNEGFRDYILETGNSAKLPYGFGDFCVAKKKRKKMYTDKVTGEKYINLPIDWKKTKEAGEYVYHFNSSTEGYTFKIYWFRSSARFKYSECWSFKPLRITSRLITHHLRIDANNQHKFKDVLALKTR